MRINFIGRVCPRTCQGSDYCRMQAAKTLRLLSDESEAVQLAIANAGGVSALLELSKSGSEQTQEQAAGVLVNLACRCALSGFPKSQKAHESHKSVPEQ
eukprot:7387676-Prymnesium_polylepis.2